MVRAPHHLGLQHVAAAAVLGEEGIVERHVGVAGLVVECDHLHAAEPHGDGAVVAGVYPHAGGVAAHQLVLRVLQHLGGVLAAEVLGLALLDAAALVDAGLRHAPPDGVEGAQGAAGGVLEAAVELPHPAVQQRPIQPVRGLLEPLELLRLAVHHQVRQLLRDLEHLPPPETVVAPHLGAAARQQRTVHSAGAGPGPRLGRGRHLGQSEVSVEVRGPIRGQY